jgi:hypothetical protein
MVEAEASDNAATLGFVLAPAVTTNILSNIITNMTNINYSLVDETSTFESTTGTRLSIVPGSLGDLCCSMFTKVVKAQFFTFGNVASRKKSEHMQTWVGSVNKTCMNPQIGLA